MNKPDKRYEMSQSIIKDNLLTGKTKFEVLLLLGIADNPNASDTWTYYIGFVPGFAAIDASYLSVKFADGKVVEVFQYES